MIVCLCCLEHSAAINQKVQLGEMLSFHDVFVCYKGIRVIVSLDLLVSTVKPISMNVPAIRVQMEVFAWTS